MCFYSSINKQNFLCIFYNQIKVSIKFFMNIFNLKFISATVGEEEFMSFKLQAIFIIYM